MGGFNYENVYTGRQITLPIPGEQRPGIHAGLKYVLARIREKSFLNSKNIKTAEDCGMGAKDKCFMVSFFRNHAFSEYAFPVRFPIG